jgi:hypothetical protein
MFTRVQALGWGFAATLGSAQMNQLDIDHANAVDGLGGGLYAPVAFVEFGGAGLKASGPFVSTGTAGFTGAVQFLGSAVCTTSFGFTGGLLSGDAFSDIRWDGFATFRTGAALIGDAGSSMAWAGTAAFAGTPAFNNGASFAAGAFGFANGFTVSGGTVNLNTTTNIGGFFNCTAEAVFNGSKTIRLRDINGVNADHTYSYSDGDIVDIPTQTASHTYRVTNTGVSRGNMMLFTMGSDATSANGNGIILVRDIDSTQIGPSIIKGTGTNPEWMWIRFDGIKWQPMTFGFTN